MNEELKEKDIGNLEVSVENKEKIKPDEEVKEIRITPDHLKIIFHNQWLHTTILFGLLVIGGWNLIVSLIDIVLFQIAAVLVMLLFIVIAYWKLYKKISPEHYFEE